MLFVYKQIFLFLTSNDNGSFWARFSYSHPLKNNKTIGVMTKREGVNAPGHVGPSLFQGNELVNTRACHQLP